MNIDDMMKDASLVDHEWMGEDSGLAREEQPDILDPQSIENEIKNPNDIKSELEAEWGYGDISPTLGYNEKPEDTQRNISGNSEDTDKNQVIKFARDLMNRGNTASVVDASLKKHFPTATLKKASKELRELFSMDGILGRIAVDSRGYESCDEAVKVASNSPYKRFIKYVIGCECGDPYMMPALTEGENEDADSTGNSTDDFFAASDDYVVPRVAHCPTSMMPLFGSAEKDIHKREAEYLTNIMNVTGLPHGIVEKLKKQKEKSVKKVQKAFCALDRMHEKRDKQKYSEKVDSSEHEIKPAENEVEFTEAPEGQMDVMKAEASEDAERVLTEPEKRPDDSHKSPSEYAVTVADNEVDTPSEPDPRLNVDPVDGNIQQEVEMEPDERPRSLSGVSPRGTSPEVSIDEEAEGSLGDLELTDGGDVSMPSPKQPKGAVDVNPANTEDMQEEIPSPLEEVDVDPDVSREGEFAGTDEIELESNDKKRAAGDLKVEMTQDFEW